MTFNTVFCRIIKRCIAESALRNGGRAAFFGAAAFIILLCGIIFAAEEVTPEAPFCAVSTVTVCREADAGNGEMESAVWSPLISAGKNLRRNSFSTWSRTGLAPCFVMPPEWVGLELRNGPELQKTGNEVFVTTADLCPRPPVRAGPLNLIPCPSAV
ncbi:MAG: hypothetical protein PHI85_01700 [Victivallaceae bacterium]|nr:hypothetical protein [Victivallaceae bacterium]